MAALVLPRRLRQQPLLGTPLDRSNPLTRGLASAVVANESATFYDAALGRFWTDPFNGDSFSATGVDGFGRWRGSPNGGSSREIIGGNSTTPLATRTGQWTLLAFVRPQTASVGPLFISSYGSDFNSAGWYVARLALGTGSAQKIIGCGPTETLGVVAADTTYSVGQLYAVAYTTDLNAGAQRLFINGVKQSGTNNYTGAQSKEFDTGVIGPAGVASPNQFYASFLYNRVLSDAEIAALSANPWQLFAAPDQIVSAASAVTLVEPALIKSLWRTPVRALTQQPQQITPPNPAWKPVHVWSMLGNGYVDHAGGMHAFEKRGNVSPKITRQGWAGVGNGAVGADSGYVTGPRFGKSVDNRGEMTWFAVFTLDALNGNECALMRADTDDNSLGLMALDVYPTAGSFTIRPLMRTSSGTAWTTAVDNVAGAVPAGGTYLVIARYRSGSVLQSAIVPLGSSNLQWGGSFTPTGGIYADVDTFKMHIGGTTNTAAASAPGPVHLAGILPYWANDAQVKALAQNPWQVLAAPDRMLGAVPVTPALAQVGAPATAQVANASTLTISKTASTAGNTLFLMLSYGIGNGAADRTIVDSTGQVWTKDKSSGALGSLGTGVELWRLTNANAGPHNLTIALPSGSYAVATVIEYAGVYGAPLDVTATNGNAASNVTAGDSGTTATTATGHELVLAALCVNPPVGTSNDGLTTPAGWTNQQLQTNTTLYVGASHISKEVTATGTQQAAWTWTEASNYAALIGTYRAALPAASVPDTALASGASAVATGSAALTTAIRMAASASATATATAALTTQNLMSGSATATATGTAALTTAIRPAATASATATATAALTTQIKLATSATASATATAALATSIRFNASATATATGTVSLTTAIALAASASATATATATMAGSAAALAATGSATATGTAALTTQIRLAGSASATASATASMAGTAAALATTASASATGSASLTTGIALGGSATATATGSANLTTAIALAGSASTTATASANLTAPTAGLSTNATASATGTGALTTQIRMASASTATATASALLGSQVQFSGSGSAAATATAALLTRINLEAAATCAANASAALQTAIALAGLGVTQTAGQALLTGGVFVRPTVRALAVPDESRRFGVAGEARSITLT